MLLSSVMYINLLALCPRVVVSSVELFFPAVFLCEQTYRALAAWNGRIFTKFKKSYCRFPSGGENVESQNNSYNSVKNVLTHSLAIFSEG